MTSRLKHKLELENVNLKSRYVNESFVQIGTPLPALADAKKDNQEYLPVWEQEVRDEKGRRRFHGAFTGGFSAGYFNSVGSKEGWAPQQFKSSRNSRAQHNQRAEDFMDEEDLAQLNDDRRLENTDTFKQDAFAGTREDLGNKSLSGALESLIVPAKTSIGQTLLQKLGWRPGQGLGPRVTHRKLKIQEGKLGRVRAGMEEDDDDEPPQASKHTYAPRDARLLVYAAKDDKEGLGFEKGQGMGKLPSRRPMYGAGLGDDDDDDDPYGAGPSASMDSRHYAFDENGELEDDVIVMGGPSESRQTTETRATGSGDRWHDGRAVLVGFVLDVKGVPGDKWWPFPEIPAHWSPQPSRVWGEKPRNETIRGAPGQPLTHEQRGTALGEEARVSAAKSVFEFMSEKDRERLEAFAKAAREKTAPPPALSLQPEPELAPERATEVMIPPLSPRTASAALQGFIPYGDDQAKQDRYRSYLRSQTHNTRHPNPELLPSTNVDEVNNELASFAASARIFKPMSYAMSSRFTSGSASLAATDMKQAKAGLHIFDPTKAPLQFAKAQNTEVEVTKVLTPREQAAADGQYGKLTRVVKDFYPVKLVCRRFHVQDPHPEGPPEGGSGTATPTAGGTGFESSLPKNDASWESKFIHQPGTDRENTPPSGDEEPEERAPRNLAEVGMAEDANQGRDILTYTKPSIDTFKAIFASDDEDDDDDEDDVPKKAVVKASEAPKDPFPVDEKPVDYATFKPVFLGGKEGGDKEKKKKDKKEKKKRKGALSFDVGDDDEEGSVEVKPKKKPRARAVEVADEWVEKASPVPAAQREPRQDDPPAASSAPRFGRKGAADFM